MTQDENSININLANQLFILEHNISEKTNIFCKRQYKIKDVQVTIDDYEYISQFNVTTMFQEEIDIILGLHWLTKLETFILNTEKKFVTFPYKKKMMTLQDITMRSKSITPSSKDFKDISKVTLPDNQNSISKMQKEYDEVIANKNQEISRLKNHSEKLLTQIKKSRDTKQRVQELEQENQDLGKKLSGKDEEASRLKNLNQNLLEEIKKMKDEKPENRNIINKVTKSEDKEELSRLRVHNQDLLTQIKKLKHDKKTLPEKLDRKTSLVDKETMTDPINITTQKEANPADVKKFSNVEVQTSQRYQEDSIPKFNQQKAISIRSKDQVARMPYQHPNHKNRYFSQSLYQHKQMTSMSKNITLATSDSQNRSYHGSRNTSSYFQEPYKLPMQKIELGWADSFTMRQFCSALKRSYRLRSSTITKSIMKKHATIVTS
jgi:autonomous glycyl radical cofactor GrcA